MVVFLSLNAILMMYRGAEHETESIPLTEYFPFRRGSRQLFPFGHRAGTLKLGDFGNFPKNESILVNPKQDVFVSFPVLSG
jgi:hypothetical protein